MTQSEFEAIGDLVTGAIQQIMKNDYNMQEIWLPENLDASHPKVNVFVSQDFFTNKDRLLVLI